ncbi:hypothetical protein [Spirosoma endbachense]|uniref:Uncharacterized protein n=1 Tax=Spirosoma endbachense TaxID=2666025 RepID=A0A6P1W1S0_9BACT|nr:hypothetical protein [Spirosoma endbachense]QHV97939.1 hypothetical protein GJR95_24315 [Spirosoma endbachense]
MLKKTFLFIATILTATSATTGYGEPDSLKGKVNLATFLDWFNNAEKYVHVKGLIVLDLIPVIFLTIQAVLFFKDRQKIKGLFTLLALLANLIGVFLVIQYAYPIASQMVGWTSDKVPSDWVSLKDDWLKYIGLHSLMGVLGWLCFVITYFVSEGKNTEVKRLSRFLNFSKNALAFFLTFVMGLSAARLYDFYFFPITYEISGVTLIEMHRPLDLAIRIIGPILFTFIVSLEVLLAALFFIEKSKTKGWLIIAVLIFLLCDTYIALQYNRPINDLFLTWTPTTIPTNWKIIRDEWLSYHLYRDIFMILGLISILLIYFVKRNKSVKQVYDI